MHLAGMQHPEDYTARTYPHSGSKADELKDRIG